MKLWLANKWDGLRNSFWFLPTVMVVASIVLSLAMIELDQAMTANWFGKLGWTYSRGPEGSRALLSTVAASMMTIASVTFSITIVALQLASSQFGPRLLRNFMRDRGNQVAIGTFIATFTYCLLILRTVNGTENEQFVPHLSVTVALLLTLLSLGVLIYFIHHSAESIQAENVIDAVSCELGQAIDTLYPECLGQGPPEQVAELAAPSFSELDSTEKLTIKSPRSDYLQAIDIDRLLQLAKDRDVVLSIRRRPGKFCLKGDELVLAWPSESTDDEFAGAIRDSFFFGRRRTLLQDIEFAIDQLVEIAVRALSPGVNDPFTAINCVDRLGAALCTLTERQIPSGYRYDENGKLRVMTDVSTIAGIVNATFDQIRQAAQTNAAVTIRLLETIGAVARHTSDTSFRAALKHQADAIHRGCQDGIKDSADRSDADRRFNDAIESLGGTKNNSPSFVSSSSF